jgi:SAM-dependent methyltransferase
MIDFHRFSYISRARSVLDMTALEYNRRTAQSYQQAARDYAESTAPGPAEATAPGLRRLIRLVPPGGLVLEVGSGPGWDADFVESHGLQVRRTDVADAFVALQRERGKPAERLDVISDDLGGPYDAVMAVAVLQHIDRRLTAGVLAKVAHALRPGGVFLAMIREGEGETWEGEYHTVFWDREEFGTALTAAGLSAESVERIGPAERPWLTFVARALA